MGDEINGRFRFRLVHRKSSSSAQPVVLLQHGVAVAAIKKERRRNEFVLGAILEWLRLILPVRVSEHVDLSDSAECRLRRVPPKPKALQTLRVR
jgi:hypothetical protein